MLPQIIKLRGVALNLLFPKRCIGCGREGEFVCAACRRKIARIMPPICPLCGRPQINGVLCPRCISWSASIDGVRAPFRFDGVIREAIHQLKYHNLHAISSLLAEFLQDYLTDYPLPGEIIVPVPLHPKRLRERGYNQSELLARELGRLTGLPVAENCLERRYYRPPQARTGSVAERRQNVTGIFTCRDRTIRDKVVILLDDVATSGATIDACAGALKEAGAGPVWGLVLAREI